VSRNLLLLLALGSLTAAPAYTQQPEPVRVTIESEGYTMRGRLFPSGKAGSRATLLLIPGYPGNPDDLLGLGEKLSRAGINVLMVNPRGMHDSEGTFTFAGSLRDIGAAFQWLRSSEARESYNIDTANVFLGGLELWLNISHPTFVMEAIEEISCAKFSGTRGQEKPSKKMWFSMIAFRVRI